MQLAALILFALSSLFLVNVFKSGDLRGSYIFEDNYPRLCKRVVSPLKKIKGGDSISIGTLDQDFQKWKEIELPENIVPVDFPSGREKLYTMEVEFGRKDRLFVLDEKPVGEDKSEYAAYGFASERTFEKLLKKASSVREVLNKGSRFYPSMIFKTENYRIDYVVDEPPLIFEYDDEYFFYNNVADLSKEKDLGVIGIKEFDGKQYGLELELSCVIKLKPQPILEQIEEGLESVQEESAEETDEVEEGEDDSEAGD